MYQYENSLIKKGYRVIAGCDEVGRGPLAGPLVCAAVILNPKDKIEGLFDSKGLSEKKRTALFEEITKRAIDYKIIFKSSIEVDKLNVYQGSKLGMIEAVSALDKKPDFVLSDAMPLTGLGIPYEAIIKGDQKSATIAAASILAKVSRDRYMVSLHDKYPEYGFDKHKGYPTKMHLEALNKYGITKEHRKTFKPIITILQTQIRLDL
ncbi:MAG: ribonuclease HII [Candidatus Izemoplasmataceae bacterium]|jgi:ribonuclease HII